MPATISIETLRDTKYRVTVEERGGKTTHEVTLTPRDQAHYAAEASAEQLLRASFEFLLEREPKEAILSRFDLPVIERYFPEYPQTIKRML
jgi:hypothetical protein